MQFCPRSATVVSGVVGTVVRCERDWRHLRWIVEATGKQASKGPAAVRSEAGSAGKAQAQIQAQTQADT